MTLYELIGLISGIMFGVITTGLIACLVYISYRNEIRKKQLELLKQSADTVYIGGNKHETDH